MADLKFEAKMASNAETIDCQLSIFTFKEDDVVIYYSPALDLSGTGYDDKQAKQSFEIAFNEFMNYTMNKKTFFKELKRLGWSIRKKKKPQSPPLNKMLGKNEYLANIFENQDFSKFNQPVTFPAYA